MADEPRKIMRVILSDTDIRKYNVPVGLSVKDCYDSLRIQFNITEEFKVMYLDEEFGPGNYFTLTDTSELTDKGTIKIIRNTNNLSDIENEESIHEQNPAESQGEENESHGEETEGLGEDDHVETIADENQTVTNRAVRSLPWPRPFMIPTFPYSVELKLQKGNEEYKKTGQPMNFEKVKGPILSTLAETIYKYKVCKLTGAIHDLIITTFLFYLD